MFSVVLPGRLPITNPQQVDETHCVFPLENASTISHVVVFMTGIQAFPQGYSATVHLLWPSSAASSSSSNNVAGGGGGEWKLLGCLKNTKPSAIFKVTPPPSSSASALTAAGGAESTTTATATLGISIEPDHIVDAQIASLQQQTTSKGAGTTQFGLPQPPSTSTTTASVSGGAKDAESIALVIAPKVAKNAFSYLSSFAPDSAPQTVPLLQKWLEQLDRKLRAQGVAWLDKQE